MPAGFAIPVSPTNRGYCGFHGLLSGLGGTLFDPPRSALVVKLIRPQQRGRFLAVDDAGQCRCGHWRIVGSWLLQYDFAWSAPQGSFVCAVRRSMRGCYQRWKLSTVRTPVREGMTRVMRDKRFVTYVLTLAGYYMLAVQVMLMLPIMVNDVAGAPSLPLNGCLPLKRVCR